MESKKEYIDYLNRNLPVACSEGNLKAVKLLISKGATDFNEGLVGACSGGHLEIIELMLAKGADNFGGGLIKACAKGHLEIVELMISYGADGFLGGLINACREGHLEIAKLMISVGADRFDLGFSNACARGHLEIAKLMISHGANNFYEGLMCTNSVKIAKLILQESSYIDNLNCMDNCFSGVCSKSRNLDIVKLFIQLGISKRYYCQIKNCKMDLCLYRLFINEYPFYYSKKKHEKLVKRSPIWTMLSYREKVPRKSLLKKLPIDLYRQLELFI